MHAKNSFFASFENSLKIEQSINHFNPSFGDERKMTKKNFRKRSRKNLHKYANCTCVLAGAFNNSPSE
jgi:hypothetical protein